VGHSGPGDARTHREVGNLGDLRRRQGIRETWNIRGLGAQGHWGHRDIGGTDGGKSRLRTTAFSSFNKHIDTALPLCPCLFFSCPTPAGPLQPCSAAHHRRPGTSALPRPGISALPRRFAAQQHSLRPVHGSQGRRRSDDSGAIKKAFSSACASASKGQKTVLLLPGQSVHVLLAHHLPGALRQRKPSSAGQWQGTAIWYPLNGFQGPAGKANLRVQVQASPGGCCPSWG